MKRCGPNWRHPRKTDVTGQAELVEPAGQTALLNLAADSSKLLSVTRQGDATSVRLPILCLDSGCALHGSIPLRSPEEADAASATWRERWPASALPAPGALISVAQGRDEIEAIGRLRYELYVARDGKAYAHADHARRSFLDAVDNVSLNFQAKRDDHLLSAVRLTWADDAADDPQLARLVRSSGLRRLSGVVVNSRFIVKPSPGGHRLVVPMLQQVYRAGLIAGARYCYLATRPQLASFFERCGFKPVDATFADPIAGPMRLLCLELHNVEHLELTRSPLLPIFLARFASARDVCGEMPDEASDKGSRR